MASDFTLRLKTGSGLSLERGGSGPTCVRKFELIGKLPYSGSLDAFDRAASLVMGLVTGTPDYATYMTAMGKLFWNSIQLHENHYAQYYEISVTYSPFERATGTFQVQVDQAVGSVNVTAGRRIAGYPVDGCPDNGGTFFNGEEITGCEVPVAEDRFTISYRHPQMFLNHAYIRRVGQLRGYPCSDAFLGYEPGEVRYMGGNFTESECEASASYSFEVSYNVTNLVVGGITIAEKSGFDAVSPVYQSGTDTTGDGKTHATKTLKGIEIIRPREWKAYKDATGFGWG